MNCVRYTQKWQRTQGKWVRWKETSGVKYRNGNFISVYEMGEESRWAGGEKCREVKEKPREEWSQRNQRREGFKEELQCHMLQRGRSLTEIRTCVYKWKGIGTIGQGSFSILAQRLGGAGKPSSYLISEMITGNVKVSHQTLLLVHSHPRPIFPTLETTRVSTWLFGYPSSTLVTQPGSSPSLPAPRPLFLSLSMLHGEQFE